MSDAENECYENEFLLRDTYMKTLMNFEPASSRILLLTVFELAYKWLQPGVDNLVSLKMPLGDKLHVALLALERPFTRVSAHMRLQVSSFPELF